VTGTTCEKNPVDCSSCKDPYCDILGPIDADLEDLPYANEEYENDPDWKLKDNEFATIVYIEDFFTDGRDFAFYIIGRPHVTAFKKGIYSMPAYNGPIEASPMMSYNRSSRKVSRENGGGQMEVSIRDSESGMEQAAHQPSKIRKDPEKKCSTTRIQEKESYA
jgi:hypothetical protein